MFELQRLPYKYLLAKTKSNLFPASLVLITLFILMTAGLYSAKCPLFPREPLVRASFARFTTLLIQRRSA